MIIFKILNQQLVQVTFAGPKTSARKLLDTSCKNNKRLDGHFARSLSTSTQGQEITTTNSQQLIPVGRNIYFRQCQPQDRKAPFSVSAAKSTYITIDQSEIELERLREKRVEEQEPIPKCSYYGQSFNEALADKTSERRLVVIFCWLQAKEKHIEKYRQFYLDRGFDVLNVKTSPLDLLMPNSGARKISEDLVRFMVDRQYSNALIHGFSVGGYMFGRTLIEMDKYEPKIRERLHNSIRGIVFDSIMTYEGLPPGVARSITSNPLGATVLENLLHLYLKLAKNFATKHYLESSDKMWSGQLMRPTLFLMSKDDKISDHRIIERLASVWTDLGIDCRKMLVDSSPHVQIFSRHQDRYVEQVDSFLRHIKALPPAPKVDKLSE